jgi:hypothetical protein
VEKLNDLYSPTIVRVIKSRSTRWAMHVASTEVGRGVYSVLVGKNEENIPRGRPRRRWSGYYCDGCSCSGMLGYGLDWAGSGWRQVAGTCECGNELSGSIKHGEFLDWL